MSTINDLKKFIRHGKQARLVTPHAEPRTDVSAVHAKQQHQLQGPYPPAAGNPAGVVTNICDAPARPAAMSPEGQSWRAHKLDIKQIVAEENSARSKMPNFPGLERWIFLDKMGDGAFSNVYRAKDTTGEYDEVAIKVVRKSEISSNQGAHILNEVKLMGQVDHPNIVKLISFSEGPQYYYIVLELCPGGELFHQIVRLTYFSEDLSRHVILQVARAIEYLHETSGIVHGDIKPENILFYPIPFVTSKDPKPHHPGNEDKVDEGEFLPETGAGGVGVIKVADFSLSKAIWDSQTMTPCGTDGYAAPEIVNDEHCSKDVDMWALGCVLYTLLCGFPPFYDESFQVLTEKVAHGQYTFLSPWWDDISSSAQDLISHLLTVDPDQRYSIKQFLAHPWIRQTDETTETATDATPLATPVSSRYVQKHPLDASVADQAPYVPASARLSNHSSAGLQRPMDFRSPGAINLREIFNVGYAIYRQEGNSRRRNHQSYLATYPIARNQSALSSLNKDYDDDGGYEGQITYQPINHDAYPPSILQEKCREEAETKTRLRPINRGLLSNVAQVRRPLQSQQQRGYEQQTSKVAVAAAQSIPRGSRQAFELNLDEAILLQRRWHHNKSHDKAPKKDKPQGDRSAVLRIPQGYRDELVDDVVHAIQPYKDRLNSNSGDQTYQDLANVSLDDIMDIWHQRTDSLEPQLPTLDARQTDQKSPEVMELAENNESKASNLPPLELYSTLIRSAPVYTLLLNNIRRECLFARSESDIMGKVRKIILESLPVSTRINRQIAAETFDISFKVRWDPLKFLVDEQYEDSPEKAIGKVITLTGSAMSAQAMTCGEYLRQVWPSTGPSVMKLMKDLVSGERKGSCVLPDGTELTFSTRPSIDQGMSCDVWVDARGTAPILAEIGEQVAWLASALRASPFRPGIVAYSRPFVSFVKVSHQEGAKNTRETYLYDIGVGVYEEPGRMEIGTGDCWHKLFGSPVVVEGFPIRRRVEQHSRGLEIPLAIMASLAGTRKITVFEGRSVLKGFSTMLIPAKCSQNAITWHLLYQEAGEHMSYLKCEQFPRLEVKFQQLEKARHFLGWCPAARMYAGEADASYYIKNSRLPRPSEYGVLSNASLSASHNVIGSLAFGVGRKDVRLPRNSYVRKMRWISEKYSIFWDITERRGWLVNGAAALLHLAHASLRHDDLGNSSMLCLSSDETQRTFASHRSDSALAMLLSQPRLALPIYPGDHEQTLKDLIEDLYDYLERAITYQVKAVGLDSNPCNQPRSALDGWDFTDLALERDPIYPRQTLLDEEGWPWVDFSRSIHAVVLFGRGFGEIIRPDNAYCPSWTTLPHGKSYLGAAVADLYKIMEQYGDYDTRPMRLCHDTFWSVTNENFSQCSCIFRTDHETPEHLDFVQVLLPSSMRHELPTHGLVRLEPTGAVIFGHSTRDQWHWGNFGPPARTMNLISHDSYQAYFCSKENTSATTFDLAGSEKSEVSVFEYDQQEQCLEQSRTSCGGKIAFTLKDSPKPGTRTIRYADDYKLGIICALHIEFMAVRVLFDETHENLPISENDDNYYALGCIAKHNVVAACLPLGTYGTNPAAIVATHMKRSFPALKFCLLVGIGAGVPSEKNQIRLGDVVVSKASGRYPGVLPYDMIKCLEFGASELNGCLSPPPAHLMGLISELESDPRGSSALQEYVRQIEARQPQYKYPGSVSDRLFASSYIHIGGDESCEQCNPSCEIRRTPRPSAYPKVHYGLIASGNKLIRSAKKRDKLGQEHNVLCVEMEGAGIVNSFPCLVIRGICDYADSHKNKIWQKYAAAVAAAYAKLLLSRLRASDSVYSTS
ncbi:hypothetical protein AbraIFM66951_002245 [Aspergillus brasiliensis]|uniref:Protein kinase domain-containing protein n=1 Tax=Aspergillus brasiliensis TaxID=319629 RepID=A0A9W5YZ14_9EURO|nr:hypothetical protein AbraCBS73388_002407 [Aspergillus brasiliensis]GKZ49674.1 hypothetical protein AbraIFM66951_002245 [Aspergillus brasiliensis]